MNAPPILVTGASGYVGSRLTVALLAKGERVRAAGRHLPALQRRPWSSHPSVDINEMDVQDEASVIKALTGCRCAYYLVHSMHSGEKDFADADRRAADIFRRAAGRVGIERIIYLGGLGDAGADLSKHLRSRAEVSEILHSGPVPVTTLRAAVILGTGSVSFEILGYLVRRLPVIVMPKWVSTRSQPIAIRNVIEYLVGCLDQPATAGDIFDIGGPEIVTYQQLMEIYEEVAGLRRFIIPVPVLVPWLSSSWIYFVNPISSALTRPLAEGLKNTVICRDHRVQKIIPLRLIDCREAIRRALIEPRETIVLPQHNMEFPAYEHKYPGDPPWVRERHLQKPQDSPRKSFPL